jgi:hypothetical protein
VTERELKAELARIEAERLHCASRKSLHERRLAALTVEQERLFLGVFVLLGAGVTGATLSAFDLVSAGGGYLCFLAAGAVRAEWRRSWRETWAEHEGYMGFLRVQHALSTRRA